MRSCLALLRPESWESLPSRAGVAALALALAYISQAMWRHGWVTPLDEASLLFHEAGHPILGALSERLAPYGGSIFQLVFPALACRHFLKQGSPLGFVFGLTWLSTSIHAMGVYIADARALALPLVGNGDRLHDWAHILGGWGLLGWDKALGSLAAGLAWGVMAAAGALLWRLWRASRSRSL